MRFEIILGPEHVLSARLALAAGDGAKTVEPPGDGRDKALLRLHIGGHRTKPGRLRLVGAVGPPEALDGVIGLPPRLEQVVDPQSAVPCSEIGMVGSPRAPGVGKDEDPLGIVHESLGLGEVGRGGTGLDGKAHLPAAIAVRDNAPGAAGHFGDHFRAKMMEHLVERGRHRRQGGQMLDHLLAACDRLAAENRLPILPDRAR